MLWIEISTLFVYLISSYANIRLLTKWKILTRGKYFWLRSVGSSSIGETIYSSLNIWLILFGSLEFTKLPQLIFWSFSLKILYTVILAYPASVLVQIIKKIDGDNYDNWSFNPFAKDKMEAYIEEKGKVAMVE